MHTSVLELASKSNNGSLKKLHQELEPELSDEMDTDQILQILMVLKEDGARRDEKLAQVIRQLDELSRFRDLRTVQVDSKFEVITEEIRQLKGRLSLVESAGMAAWSMKKVTQWSALISGVGVIWGGIVGIIIWLIQKVF